MDDHTEPCADQFCHRRVCRVARLAGHAPAEAEYPSWSRADRRRNRYRNRPANPVHPLAASNR